MEDIVGVEMSPTSHVSNFKTAEKGLSLLFSVNCSLADTTKARRHDDAIGLLEINCNLEQELALSATDPRPPPKSFHNMKLCISTYAALTWSFFGDYFHLYNKLLELRKTLDTSYLATITEHFLAQIF